MPATKVLSRPKILHPSPGEDMRISSICAYGTHNKPNQLIAFLRHQTEPLVYSGGRSVLEPNGWKFQFLNIKPGQYELIVMDVVTSRKAKVRIQRADEWEPSLPEPDDQGNFPALEYARASLARKIFRHRRKLGLTQLELARRSGVRAETLKRIEHGTHSPTVATVAKIDKALTQAEAARRRANSK